MIVKGMGDGPFTQTLSTAFNWLWYGLPSNVPVPVPGAPQTLEQMTSGTFTPDEAASIGQSQYQEKVKNFFDAIPENAGAAPQIVGTGVLLLIGAVVVGYVLLRK